METVFIDLFAFLRLHPWDVAILGAFGIITVWVLRTYIIRWHEIVGAWQDWLEFLKLHPKFTGGVGFLSIFLVWAIPSYIIRWNDEFSYAYFYGDHLVLPSFNALAFWLLAQNTRRIPVWTIVFSVTLALGLILTFDPVTSSFLKAGSVDSIKEAYHSAFVVAEFSFIIFVLLFYPFLRGTFVPLRASLALSLLIEFFLVFALGADADQHSFSTVENIAPAGLIVAGYLLVVLHRKFNIFLRATRKVRGQQPSQ